MLQIYKDNNTFTIARHAKFTSLFDFAAFDIFHVLSTINNKIQMTIYRIVFCNPCIMFKIGYTKDRHMIETFEFLGNMLGQISQPQADEIFNKKNKYT